MGDSKNNTPSSYRPILSSKKRSSTVQGTSSGGGLAPNSTTFSMLSYAVMVEPVVAEDQDASLHSANKEKIPLSLVAAHT
jgi:hypothetical protein